MNQLAKILATGFGTGLAPVAPGSIGALLGTFAIFILYKIEIFSSEDILKSSIYLIVLSIFVTVLGVWASNKLEPEWGHDNQKIVIDEIAGVFVTLIFIPIHLKSILFGYILFRIFDIWKPLGIRKLDQIKSGWGVMLDDIAAGVLANICLQLAILSKLI